MKYLENSLDNLIGNKKRILITGGAGFIGSNLIIRLIKESSSIIFNLDKLGYASNLEPIEEILNKTNQETKKRYQLLKVDLSNPIETAKAIKKADPDLIMHLAAESHVDKSIFHPESFIKSNIIGTFNLLNSSKDHYENLTLKRKLGFRFLHVSTDEVFGSLDSTNSFSENSPYDPRSPYSASKASSDHLAKAWYHTYNFPVIITNCSNNFGPYQFREKLIPMTILNAINLKSIPIYGDGKNIRDWLFVEDHIDALLLALSKGELGQSYCIGGNGEKENIELVRIICEELDNLIPNNKPHFDLIEFIEDRKGHDRRYSINAKKIKEELGWVPKFSFKKALNLTIDYYLYVDKFS
tara:strand:+ start:36 stop:1097 length:1062 start_codon:yes stop_codon:yes gene_type:complete